MNIAEGLEGAAYILALVVAFSILTVVFVNLLVPGVHITFSLGYSMCGERTPHLDFLTLKETTCSIVPGDALVVVDKWPPKVGDVACVNTNVGIVCHRVVRAEGNVYVVEGDAAKWDLPFTRDAYFGTVVAKLPRIFSMPVITVHAIVTGSPEALALIDAGSYHPFDR